MGNNFLHTNGGHTRYMHAHSYLPIHTGFSSSYSVATSTPNPTKQTSVSMPQSPLPGFKKLTPGEQWRDKKKGGLGYHILLLCHHDNCHVIAMLIVNSKHLLIPAATPPQITSQPTSPEEIPTGKPVIFSIQATGTKSMNYQWQCWKPKGGA